MSFTIVAMAACSLATLWEPPCHSEVQSSLLRCCCRFREKAAVQQATEEFKDIIDRFIALQFLFDKQWKAVKVSNTCEVQMSFVMASPAAHEGQ